MDHDPIARTITNNPRLTLIDADGLADNTEPAIIVLDIRRQDIETGNIASAMERLHVLTDSAENTLLYRESLIFQVSGYDHDPRELPAIPEVRAFFRRLVAEWPHWLWFLHRGVGAILLLLTLLCNIRVVREQGEEWTEFESMTEVHNTLADLLDRGNALFESYAVTDMEVVESARSAVSDLMGESA
ncbi:MAG: DUF1817 domain-containing protein [Pseudomonadota bacterium]|nr:DUF1817 domain-containing protein [Pseudomonadota bacterium]MDP1904177.1 DUF1817 domain-containing protein [Pseudomonadota bacterium]